MKQIISTDIIHIKHVIKNLDLLCYLFNDCITSILITKPLQKNCLNKLQNKSGF